MISADRIHRFANLLVGLNIPRSFIRKLSKTKRERLFKYIEYIWLTANDNDVPEVNRPKWLPKRYIYAKWYQF